MAAAAEKIMDVNELPLASTIGFTGSVLQGLQKHPNGQHIMFPLGSTLVIEDLKTGVQEFLQGHTNAISCISISKSGKFVASGQVTHMGFQADIILWDFESRKLVRRFTLHKVKVQALAFSPGEKYLASLGGEDDNSVIVWDLVKGAAICGSPASKDSAGVALSLAYLNNNELKFVTGGNFNLRVWELNIQDRKIRPNDCQTGQIKRIINCITVDPKDEFMYCGTTTGDLMQVALATGLFKHSGPAKSLFSMGIVCVSLSPNADHVIVGCGDGTIASLKFPKLNVVQQTQVQGSITSLTFDSPVTFFASTSHSNVYHIPVETFEPELKSTGHYSAINDIIFPADSSELFATASDTDIRVWDSQTTKELLRIHIPGVECKSVIFSKSGHSLLSGWNDGKIRAFGPQTGRLQFEIVDAHKRSVTALAVTDILEGEGADATYKIVSGGEDGQVRVWRVNKRVQTMEQAMKEHKGTVTSIHIRRNHLECVSSSSDGSCIVWDLTRFVRNQVLFAPSFFKAVKYYPDESQLLTSGTDRKVAYWEAFDGSLIREIEASQTDAINSLDITKDGAFFVIGGSDRLVKVYRYEEGDVSSIGVGHSTEITKVKISPDQKKIVSVSTDGAIYIWEGPWQVLAGAAGSAE